MRTAICDSRAAHDLRLSFGCPGWNSLPPMNTRFTASFLSSTMHIRELAFLKAADLARDAGALRGREAGHANDVVQRRFASRAP